MLHRSRPWFLALAFWWIVLFILSHQSRLLPPGPNLKHVDKVEHAAYFTLGGLLFFLGLRASRPSISFPAAAVLTILFCSGIGALDEYHQSFIPNRSGNDPGDWLADTVGGLLGALVGIWLHRRHPKRKQGSVP